MLEDGEGLREPRKVALKNTSEIKRMSKLHLKSLVVKWSFVALTI